MKGDLMTTMRCDVVNGGLVRAPIWREGKRAKNWAAVIDVDGTAPGGFSRRFLPYGRGPVFYMVEQVALFDALEFAADYVSYGGNPHPERWYGVVIAKTDDFLELEAAKDGAKAVLLARTKRTTKADFLAALATEKAHHEARAKELADEMARVAATPDSGLAEVIRSGVLRGFAHEAG